MVELLSVGDVARRLNVRPSQVTQLFYERRLRDDLCPIVGDCSNVTAYNTAT